MSDAAIHPEAKSAATVTSFPRTKAFVLQFSIEAGPQTGLFCGRVEHVTTGAQSTFSSTEELWSFVREMLVETGTALHALPASRRAG